MKEVLDWLFRYILAWYIIFLFPLWLPIWLAKRIKEWENETNAMGDK